MQDQSVCLNCGATVTDLFCAHCGQRVREPRGPLWGLCRELFDSFFDIDSRFWRSLYVLVAKPGELTCRFLAGQRASMLPPVRMYLVLSLLLFVVIEIPVPDASQTNVYIGEQLVGREAPDPGLGETKIGTTVRSRALPWVAPILLAKEERLRQMDPQLVLSKIFSGMEASLSQGLILFIPLLALVLKILFLGSKRLYYDHLIFALHFQSFLFLLIITGWCLSWVLPLANLAVLASPIYLALALRRVYGQRWRWLLPKLAVLLLSYFFTLGLVLAATFGYTVLTV